jgi:hypothetical protein
MKVWTEARLRSFIMSCVRSGTRRWAPKYQALNDAFVESQKNPKTGRMRKMYRCAITQKLFPASDMQVDHIDPVIPEKWGRKTKWLGYNWNELLPRLFCDKENLQAVSKEAHKAKTKEENARRKRTNTVRKKEV